jgi:hypothetical protein
MEVFCYSNSVDRLMETESGLKTISKLMDTRYFAASLLWALPVPSNSTFFYEETLNRVVYCVFTGLSLEPTASQMNSFRTIKVNLSPYEMKASSAVQLLLRYLLISEPEKREPSASRLGRFKLTYPMSKVLTEVTLGGPDFRGIGTTISGVSSQSPSRQPSTLSRLHFSSNFSSLVLTLTTVFQARSYIQFYNKTFAFIFLCL